jgi:hypothetical protein
MEESFQSVQQNIKTKVHFLITYLMIIAGLVPVIFMFYNYPKYLLSLPFTIYTLLLNYLPFVMQILLFVAAIGVRNFKKWGLRLGLIASISIILLSIFFIYFSFRLIVTATNGYIGTFKLLGISPYNSNILLSSSFVFSNLVGYLVVIGPILSVIINLIIFFYLFQKRNLFK